MKIALDIDGVLADFVQGMIGAAKERGLGEHFPATSNDAKKWMFSDRFSEVFSEVSTQPEFWLKLRPLPYSLPLHFTPYCYLTSRPIATWVTEQWLALWRFPKAPVFTVSKPDEKLAVAEREGIDLLIDDYFETVEQFIDAGRSAVLFKAPYRRGHEVSHLPQIGVLSHING